MKFPHGLMFHHFHGTNHPKGQGSISAQEFQSIINHFGTQRILTAQEWQHRSDQNTLQDHDLCITFDDGLRCQFDIAYPVLKKNNLTAFWFVPTSFLRGGFNPLEVYRYFRNVYFEDIDAFYDAFFDTINESDLSQRVTESLKGFNPDSYTTDYAFYTTGDRKFRYVRDQVLGTTDYGRIMDQMIQNTDMDPATVNASLYLTEKQIQTLHQDDHVIGLHSHTHPTRITNLGADGQRQEYETNQAILTEIVEQKPSSMSHPLNTYNDETLGILRDLGISLGFRDTMEVKPDHSALEQPRIDHSIVLRLMTGDSDEHNSLG